MKRTGTVTEVIRSHWIPTDSSKDELEVTVTIKGLDEAEYDRLMLYLNEETDVFIGESALTLVIASRIANIEQKVDDLRDVIKIRRIERERRHYD